MTRLVVAVAAAVVTYAISENPYYAFQAFALVYGATGFLDPNKRLSGSRLADLRAPQASYGSPIPYLRGFPRLAGVFVWASAKHEIATTTTTGGKGGPGVDSTVFTYEIDCLIMLAINECYGIRRVWSNGRLVWSNGDDADDETIIASGDAADWRDMRFYGGALDQLPDPVYEAAVGIGNAPAYRGRATVFIEGLNLGGSGQLPVLTFEVIAEPFSNVLVPHQSGYPVSGVGGSGSIGPGITGYGVSPMTLTIPQWDANRLNSTLWVYDLTTNPPTPINSYDLTVPNTDNTMLGTSDVSCYAVASASGPDKRAAIYFDDGVTHSLYDFNVLAGSGYRDRVAIRGDDVIFGSYNSAADLRLYRCDKTGSPLLIAGTALPNRIQSLAISSDGFVYAVDLNGSSLYKLDLATLTLQATIAMPVTGESVFVVLCDGADVYVRSFTFRKYNGSGWDTIVVTLSVEMRLGSVFDQPGAVVDGVLYTLDTSPAGPPFTYQIWNLAQTIPQQAAQLDDVVLQLCLRTGHLTAADVDVTELAGKEVRALAVSQVGPIRQTLDMLSGAFLFEYVEGQKLKAVLRGGVPAMTIPFNALGASPGGDAEPLPKKRANNMEIPARVTIKYANVLNDFQDGAESSDRLVTESIATTVIEIPLGMTPSEARKLADVQAMDLAVSLVQIGPVMLDQSYARLEPTDVIVLTDEDGSTFRARITKGTIEAGVYTFELILDDATVINSVIATDETYSASTLIRVLATTTVELLDIPILRDADDDFGIYAGFEAGSGRWPGAALTRSLDDVTYTRLLSTAVQATMGEATSTLGDFLGGNVFDETNTLTVDVGDNTLSSSTRTALLTTNANALLVGAEIIQFRTAALLSPGVYLLSGLRRGLRGTEWTMPDHTSSERVVLLDTTLRRVEDERVDLDVPYYYKAVTIGRSIASVTSEVFTDTGVGLMPFAPVDLRLAGAVFSWHRRSRLSSRLLAIVDPPLGETSESYDVELRDGADALVESATVSSASYTFSAPVLASYYATVWQKSAEVGRGYPAVLEF